MSKYNYKSAIDINGFKYMVFGHYHEDTDSWTVEICEPYDDEWKMVSYANHDNLQPAIEQAKLNLEGES